MTVQHAIVTFPSFDASEALESVRRQFDPLASLLDAHVTLVFPFEENVSADFLREHIVAATAGATPFEIALAAPTSEDDGYLFLRIVDGRERIVDLHRRLYSGRLASHLSKTRTYQPHVTIGRLDSSERLGPAAEEARARLIPPLLGRVDSVSVFQVDGTVGSVTLTVPLGPAGRSR
jgi:2'-5' RNA ligase